MKKRYQLKYIPNVLLVLGASYCVIGCKECVDELQTRGIGQTLQSKIDKDPMLKEGRLMDLKVRSGRHAWLYRLKFWSPWEKKHGFFYAGTLQSVNAQQYGCPRRDTNNYDIVDVADILDYPSKGQEDEVQLFLNYEVCKDISEVKKDPKSSYSEEAWALLNESMSNDICGKHYQLWVRSVDRKKNTITFTRLQQGRLCLINSNARDKTWTLKDAGIVNAIGNILDELRGKKKMGSLADDTFLPDVPEGPSFGLGVRDDARDVSEESEDEFSSEVGNSESRMTGIPIRSPKTTTKNSSGGSGAATLVDGAGTVAEGTNAVLGFLSLFGCCRRLASRDCEDPLSIAIFQLSLILLIIVVYFIIKNIASHRKTEMQDKSVGADLV